jgi:16S rRNA (guanine966-N2)-methyltransferase
MPKVRSQRGSARRPDPARGSGRVRIIGGRWRGRLLTVPEAPGLRPSGDRVRETLFNWLQGDIAGARCLDLFAGTGALGLEALSRGAGHCDFVDSHSPALRAIQSSLVDLGGSTLARCHAMPADQFLDRHPGPWDIVFLDPPFDADLLARTLIQLEAGALHADSLVYLESGTAIDTLPLPAGWALLRSKRAGAVHFGLCARGT